MVTASWCCTDPAQRRGGPEGGPRVVTATTARSSSSRWRCVAISTPYSCAAAEPLPFLPCTRAVRTVLFHCGMPLGHAKLWLVIGGVQENGQGRQLVEAGAGGTASRSKKGTAQQA